MTAYPNPTLTLSHVETELREATIEGQINPYEILARMLLAAGAVSDWDSGTIENVLAPAEAITDATTLPWVGNTGADGEAHAFWASVAHNEGWEHDWPALCPECGALLPDNNDAVGQHLVTAHPGLI